MFHIFFPFSLVNKNEIIKTKLTFSAVNIKKIIKPPIFKLFAGKLLPQPSLTYDYLNL